VLRVFAASRSRRGAKGRDDRRFLEALHYFTVRNFIYRVLPECFGHWNSAWMGDSQTTNFVSAAPVSWF
jgi:hypothetical protein